MQKHCITDPDAIARVLRYKEIFAWHVASPRRYRAATPFSNPPGAVVFVVLHQPEAVFANTVIAVQEPELPASTSSSSVCGSSGPAAIPQVQAHQPTKPTGSAEPSSNNAPAPSTDLLDSSAFPSLTPVALPTVSTLQGLERATLLTVRAYDAGLHNLGNTCFFNALLTC